MGSDRESSGCFAVATAEECRAEIAQIRERIRQLKAAVLDGTSTISKASAMVKVQVYNATIKTLQDQLDYYDPSRARRLRTPQRTRISVVGKDNPGWDFFESSGACWSDLSGHSWEQVEDGDVVQLGTSMPELQTWLAEAAEELTPTQRLYINAYYNEGYSLNHIAALYRRNKSTICTVIQNGLRKMKDWVETKRLIQVCTMEDGRFDWIRFIKSSRIFPWRQRELMIIVLSKRAKDYVSIADRLGLSKSALSRTLSRLRHKIQVLGLSGRESAYSVSIQNWDTADKFTLASQTEMPVYFYFRFCFRDKVGDLTRYQYEIAARRLAGMTVTELADEFEVDQRTISGAYKQSKRVKIDPNCKPVWDDSIAAKIDPSTYVKLKRMVVECADT